MIESAKFNGEDFTDLLQSLVETDIGEEIGHGSLYLKDLFGAGFSGDYDCYGQGLEMEIKYN